MPDVDKIRKCHGVKATTMGLDEFTMDTVFQAAYFRGWGELTRMALKADVDGVLADEKVFWHLLLETDEKDGRMWAVVDFEDVVNVVGFKQEKR